MTEQNGQGVKPPEGGAPAGGAPAAGSGAPAGGAPEGGAPAGGGQPGGGAVDQEFEVTLSNGQKVKVKTSDIMDEKGVTFKNRAAEAARRAQEAEEENARIMEQNQAPDGGRQPKPGEFVDPNDGQIYNEDDLNRMFMTGEGIKANRIMMSQINVRKVVTDVVVENESKARTVSKYPDLQNPQTIFFKRVAQHMSLNGLYGKPNGLQLASAAVAEMLTEENVPFTRGRVTAHSPESQRQSQTNGGVIPGGNGQRVTPSVPELDEEGKRIAARLGVDPVKMAKRLEGYLSKRGQPREGRE